MECVTILGGGLGAQLVIRALADINKEMAIICGEEQYYVASILDDNEGRRGELIVVQGCDPVRIECPTSCAEDSHSLICSSSDIGFRERCWNMYSEHGGGWLNLLRSEFKGDHIGIGNIIFPDVHTDMMVKIGNNNVISAGTVICHHSTIGSHNLFGPGCLFSGSVTIGSGCRFGSGIVVKPNIKIGDGCSIASGAVICGDLADGTKVKATTKLAGPIFSGSYICKKAVE